jgi:peptide/nickel transport system ATP-binding protein
VTVQAQLRELIRHLCAELGTSFVLVTHDLGVAVQVSDRIAVLYAGRLAEVGPAADIFRSPQHPYSAGLLRSRLRLDDDKRRPLVTLPGEPPDPRAHPPGCAFAPRCEHREDGCEETPPALAPVRGSSFGGVTETAGADGAGSGGPGERRTRMVACLRTGAISTAVASQVSLGPWVERPPAVIGGPPPAVLIHGVRKSFWVKGAKSSSGPSGKRAPLVRKRVELQALRGFDLEIVAGEAVALVGESGCGKSTLLRVVAGLVPLDGGSVEFGRGARPQMVFQDAGASLTPWLTVGEMIGERLREEHLTRTTRQQRVGAALAQVGLPAEVAKAKPAQLSGGQRQRVALARTIVVPPKVLLCDEPTSALDVSLAATVLNLIGRLRRELGMAVLFVTHDLAAARVVADRIAVMYLGRVVELGTSEDVCSQPVHPYTRALLATVPDVSRRGVHVRGEPASPLDPPAGCAFHTRCPMATDACRVVEQSLEPLAGMAHRLVACSRISCPDGDGGASRLDQGSAGQSRPAVGGESWTASNGNC